MQEIKCSKRNVSARNAKDLNDITLSLVKMT